MYNTIIIGAGPVGSYLATKLARLDYEVLVIEKKSVAGTNVCCTGIISKECYNLLGIPEIAIRQSNSAKFFAPSGKYLRLCRDDNVAVITDRPFLEQALVNKAKALGAEYIFTTQVESIENKNDYLLVKANSCNSDKVFEAETVVIATGYGSELPWKLGLGRISKFSIGAQAEVDLNAIDEVEIYFDQAMAPGGFSWLVPTRDNKGLAGMITSYQPELHLNQLLLQLKSQAKIVSTEVARNYAVIPIQSLPKTYTHRLLVVGEAAGQVKPTTGGGIYYGILCADIATNVLHQALSSGDMSASKLSAYQKQWKRRLVRELTVGYWTQRLWSKLTNTHIEYLISIAQKKRLPEIIYTMNSFSFDWHSRLFLQLMYSLLPFAKIQKKL